jgi:hypothetical protein
MYDTVTDTMLKVDMCIINDKIKQGYNTENEIATMKGSAEDPNDTKFISDRVKVSIENTVIMIDT